MLELSFNVYRSERISHRIFANGRANFDASDTGWDAVHPDSFSCDLASAGTGTLTEEVRPT